MVIPLLVRSDWLFQVPVAQVLLGICRLSRFFEAAVRSKTDLNTDQSSSTTVMKGTTAMKYHLTSGS